jgi:hypothetical protein
VFTSPIHKAWGIQSRMQMSENLLNFLSLIDDNRIIIVRGCIQKFPDWVDKYTLAKINTRWEAIRSVMAAKLTRLTHKIAIELHVVAESCTICSSRSRRSIRKLLDTPSYMQQIFLEKLLIAQLFKIFPAFYEMSRYFTVLTKPPRFESTLNCN